MTIAARKYPLLFVILFLVSSTLLVAMDSSSTPTEDPFLPTWKLLSTQEKRQFIAGYIQGWKDAAKVTDVAITFLEENPSDPVSSLKRIRSLYDLSVMSPDMVASRIDDFFSKSENRAASLSQAITAAQLAPVITRGLPK